MTPEHTAQIIDEIRGLHRRRVFAIKTQSKLDRSLESYIRINYTDWNPDADEKARKKANAEVSKIIKAARKSEGEIDVIDLVEMTDNARTGFDERREVYEKAMKALAKDLPIYSWVEGIRGFGALGLAIILGEAGDLSDYPREGTKHGDAALWKRLGVGCLGGIRQGGLPKNAGKEEWIAHGYNRARRSRIWTLGDAIIKAQVRKVKDDDDEDTGERIAIGTYGEIYLKRKAHELARNPEMSAMHAHRRAQRYMEKRLLRDLWRAWRRTRTGMAEKLHPRLSSAEIHA